MREATTLNENLSRIEDENTQIETKSGELECAIEDNKV